MENFTKINKGCLLDESSISIKYDKDYLEKYKLYSQTDLGKKIHKFRRAYVECLAVDGDILDYGCGFGELVTQDTTNRWRGTDINVLALARLGDKQVGLDQYSLFTNICLFDVFEHFQNPYEFCRNVKPKARIFISLPLWPHESFEKLIYWRHWKPQEHFLYANVSGFNELLKEQGFDLIDHNTFESSLGRLDIHTQCWEKICVAS